MTTVTGIRILAVAFIAVFADSCSGAAGDDVESPSAPQWSVVWADDFEGETLDRTKWSPEESCWGGGNNERQCYTDRADNIRVGDGFLRLIAKPEVHVGPLFPAHARSPSDELRRQEYTSGKVSSRGRGDWKYGKISARIKLPKGQGAWPAFWMMPTESSYGEWPLSGEIDIMEAANLDTPCEECAGGIEHRTSAALHFGDLAPKNTYLTAKSEHAKAAGPAGDFHVYSIEWAEGVIQWFVDDKIFLRLETEDWDTASKVAAGNPYAPFDQPFHLNINLAVGGNLAERSNGRGFDPNTFPAEMLVDWVRVQQCDGDRETGRACLSKQQWDGDAVGPNVDQAP